MNRLSLKNKMLLSVAALLTGLLGYPVVNADESAAETEFGKILNPLTAKKLLPGYYFAVYKSGEKVFERTEGLADEKTKIAAGENTLYAIASMSKPITTLALLTLTESTDLELSDPVSKYLSLIHI